MKQLYNNKIKLIRALSAVLTACVLIAIFLMSAQEGDDSNKLSTSFLSLFVWGEIDFYHMLHVVVREIAHMIEYAAMSVPLFVFVSTFIEKKKPLLSLPIAFSVLYAISDELHQYFVPGRSCEIIDVVIDSFGAICGIILTYEILKLICRKKNES